MIDRCRDLSKITVEKRFERVVVFGGRHRRRLFRVEADALRSLHKEQEHLQGWSVRCKKHIGGVVVRGPINNTLLAVCQGSLFSTFTALLRRRVEIRA